MTDIGDMIIGGVAGAPAKLADVAVGSYLRSGGVTTAPLWSTLILPNAATAYRLPVATSANTLGELVAVGATGEYLAGATGAIPAWAALNQAAFVAGVDLSTTGGPTFDHLHLTTDLPVSEGGTGASTFTLNGILYGNAANAIGVTAAGDDTKYLTATSGGVPTWDILNQGQVAGLTTADTPTFAGATLTSTLFFSGAAIRNISRSVDDQSIYVNAGSAYNKGASIQFYGEDQASFPGDAYIVAGSSDRAALGSIVELAFRDAGTYRKLLTLTYAATPVALVTGSLQCTTGFGCNSKTAQTAYVVGAAAPAGGTGATAGAYDTAINRNAMITLLNNIRLALLANGIAVNA
jgi:hypothetical protein